MKSRTPLGRPELRKKKPVIPNNCVYLGMRPSTMRYHKLVAKAQETGLTWQEVARLAIDWYLNRYPPKNPLNK